jgi:hypothetical protein
MSHPNCASQGTVKNRKGAPRRDIADAGDLDGVAAAASVLGPTMALPVCVIDAPKRISPSLNLCSLGSIAMISAAPSCNHPPSSGDVSLTGFRYGEMITRSPCTILWTSGQAVHMAKMTAAGRTCRFDRGRADGRFRRISPNVIALVNSDERLVT